MTIQVGDPVPDVAVRTFQHNELKPVSVAALAHGKLILFAIPGAFTPACSARHLPGFVEHAADFKARGVETIACIAVNDAFVMDAWGRASSVGGKVLMLADGNGDFTRAVGLDQDGTAYGMGFRSQRYALIAEHGRVTQLFVEEPGAFEVSAAAYVLAHM